MNILKRLLGQTPAEPELSTRELYQMHRMLDVHVGVPQRDLSALEELSHVAWELREDPELLSSLLADIRHIAMRHLTPPAASCPPGAFSMEEAGEVGIDP